MRTRDHAEVSMPGEIVRDEERLSYHEAAHAVAMWKLGLGIQRVMMEPEGGRLVHAEPARVYDVAAATDRRTKRYIIEQNAIVRLAGNVAEQLLRPGSAETDAASDHHVLHDEMYTVEDDASTHITWCDYLWQRTYTLLAWPGRWKLVVALAQLLRKHRTIDGAAAEEYLRRVQDVVQRDPSMPNAVLIGELTYVCSPLHRTWHATAIETILPPKRTDLPEGVGKIEALIDLRSLHEVLGPLSARALRCLAGAKIRSVWDLRCWSARALSSIKEAGKVTVAEIVDAAARAGVELPPDHAPFPWAADPKRWR